MGTLPRAVEFIRLFIGRSGVGGSLYMSLPAIAERLGRPKVSCWRMLRKLLAVGWVKKAGDSYTLGPGWLDDVIASTRTQDEYWADLRKRESDLAEWTEYCNRDRRLKDAGR